METTENSVITTDSATDDGKTIAIIAYITLIGFVIALVMNNDKKLPLATFHIRQTLGLMLTSLVIGMIGLIPILGWLINFVAIFFLLYMWIMGLLNAINGRYKTLPFLGDKYAEWFKNL
ncbi:hypothetical protein MASR2M47_34940 [Draconibacterium sp.]|jgi:uncharacterized membrane protein